MLVGLLIVLFATIIGGEIGHPGNWHDKFKVGLGLDLSSGTTITIKAVPLKEHGQKQTAPSASAMNQSIAILNSRVNGQGFTGAKVQQQGSDLIVVSVPGKSAEQIAPLLSSAVLRFRQVLLAAPGKPIALPPPGTGTTTQPPTASPSPTSSPSPGGSASPSPSPSASGGSGQAAGAHALGGAGHAKASGSASPSPSPSGSASPSSSPSGAASPSPSPTPKLTKRLATAADASGDITKVTSKAVISDFNRLNCADSNWQKRIYGGNPAAWDDPSKQVVGCDPQGNKYVLDVAKVLGTNLTKVATVLNAQSQYVVNFDLDGQGQKAFGLMTSMMVSKYFNSQTGQATSVLDQFAIVLDGKVISAPQVTSPITTGSGEITGGGTSGFTRGQANKLTNVLKYGAVPLAFTRQNDELRCRPQLGASQLHAGLLAAAVGLLLVVFYSVFYYRGPGDRLGIQPRHRCAADLAGRHPARPSTRDSRCRSPASRA